MHMLKKIWFWTLINNSSGLACLITAWLIGLLAIVAAQTNLVSDINIAFTFRYCFLSGIGLFIFVPLVERLFKNS